VVRLVEEVLQAEELRLGAPDNLGPVRRQGAFLVAHLLACLDSPDPDAWAVSVLGAVVHLWAEGLPARLAGFHQPLPGVASKEYPVVVVELELLVSAPV